MDQKRLRLINQHIDGHRCAGEAKRINRKSSGGHGHDLVDRVNTMSCQPIHLLDTVMDSVKLPEEGHCMEGAVRQVKACIGDKDDLDRL
ncbi:hypothetical protein D9M70_395340 [compost metagenome]